MLRITSPRASAYPLLFLQPLSSTTTDDILRRCNTDMLERTTSCVVQVDFSTFFGRTCICFGSSRACEVRLSGALGIDPEHFKIHFDMRTGRLHLSDTSKTGTTIRQGKAQVLLLSSTYELSAGMEFELSLQQTHRFRVVVPERDPIMYKKYLKKYARSIGKEYLISLDVSSKPSSPALCSETYSAAARGSIGLRNLFGVFDAASSFQRKRKRSLGLSSDQPTKRLKATDDRLTSIEACIQSRPTLQNAVRNVFSRLWSLAQHRVLLPNLYKRR